MASSNAPLNAPPASSAASSNDSKRTSTLDAKSENSDKATEELSGVIDDLLNQLGTKFSTISEELLAKMDEMSQRLDNLEAAIQAGKGNEGK